MKIYSKEQIYSADAKTLERQNISSADLMERAGLQIFNWLHIRLQGEPIPIHIFCGIGNNGGDGLVLARHLILDGYDVKTYIVNCSEKRSKDFLINYDRIKNVTKKWPILLNCEDDFPEIQQNDIIVDAIFGIGLNRVVDQWIKKLFIHFKKSEAFTLSIDIPSGLSTDTIPSDENAVVWASSTLSLVCPKLVFFLPQTVKYTVQWEVLNIGLDAQFLNETETNIELISKNEVLPLYIPRAQFSHKGDFGHALIIGGSYGKIGAVTLACKSVLSVGAGLVTAFVPKCGYIPIQSAFPEAMVITDMNEDILTNINFNITPTSIGFGVGAGTEKITIKAFENFLKSNEKPLVIDADGLNILSKNKNLLKLLPKDSVLTPHPKELERLIGTWQNDFEKLNKAAVFSKKYKVIIVIKGANTITIHYNKFFINTTGNPGLATAGSGDVLTGIITGLISQGYSNLNATIFGIYLHGRSADLAVEKYSYQSLIASHVIEFLGDAYLDLFRLPEPQNESQESNSNENKKDK